MAQRVTFRRRNPCMYKTRGDNSHSELFGFVRNEENQGTKDKRQGMPISNRYRSVEQLGQRCWGIHIYIHIHIHGYGYVPINIQAYLFMEREWEEKMAKYTQKRFSLGLWSNQLWPSSIAKEVKKTRERQEVRFNWLPWKYWQRHKFLTIQTVDTPNS